MDLRAGNPPSLSTGSTAAYSVFLAALACFQRNSGLLTTTPNTVTSCSRTTLVTRRRTAILSPTAFSPVAARRARPLSPCHGAPAPQGRRRAQGLALACGPPSSLARALPAPGNAPRHKVITLAGNAAPAAGLVHARDPPWHRGTGLHDQVRRRLPEKRDHDRTARFGHRSRPHQPAFVLIPQQPLTELIAWAGRLW